jgi:hypothetical protein
LYSLTPPPASDDLISEKALTTLPGVPQASPLSLPVQVMVLPLTKRFRYHFTGNRTTNSLGKVSPAESRKTASPASLSPVH